jgi:hypothetical protein
MSDPADLLFKVYVFRKPHSLEKILYRTLDAAQRACTSADGEIEEWIAIESSPRLRLVRTWVRLPSGAFVNEVIRVF